MKVFVTDKYRILTFIVICALIGITSTFIKNKSVPTEGNIKRLPIYSVQRDDTKIAITFDCAWGADDVDDILETLKKHNCKATFFVLGTWAEKYPEAVKKICADGHEIGNHSYNHAYYTKLTKEEQQADMKKGEQAIEKVTGKAPVLFRAPSGDYNNDVIEMCGESGKICIQWDVDSLDWKGLNTTQMNERIMEKTKSGSVLLFHNDTDYTAKSLDTILTSLSGKGFQYATVSELIYKDNYMIDHTGKQVKIEIKR